MQVKNTITRKIELKVYSLQDIPDEWKRLCEMAKLYSTKAYAKYSKFRVGAAVLLDDGNIVSANNQENAAYPSGLCAERSALFYTHANYPDHSIQAIAIYSPDAASLLTPCGACRQVMIEYETIQKNPIRTLILHENNVYVLDSTKDWLPFEFSENILFK